MEIEAPTPEFPEADIVDRASKSMTNKDQVCHLFEDSDALEVSPQLKHVVVDTDVPRERKKGEASAPSCSRLL